MRGMLAPLSTREEAALRKVGVGSTDPLHPDHVRRLWQLELIEWSGFDWRLTAIGRHRYDCLVTNTTNVKPAA